MESIAEKDLKGNAGKLLLGVHSGSALADCKVKRAGLGRERERERSRGVPLASPAEYDDDDDNNNDDDDEDDNGGGGGVGWWFLRAYFRPVALLLPCCTLHGFRVPSTADKHGAGRDREGGRLSQAETTTKPNP